MISVATKAMASFKLGAVNSLIDKKLRPMVTRTLMVMIRMEFKMISVATKAMASFKLGAVNSLIHKKTKADGDKNINGDDKNGVQDDISGDQSNGFIQARSGEQSNRQKTKGVDDKISAYQTNSFFQLGMSSKKTSIVAVSSDK